MFNVRTAGLIAAFVGVASIYSLTELHRASTQHAERVDMRNSFATEFKHVVKWHSEGAENVRLPVKGPTTSVIVGKKPQGGIVAPPPDKLGACIRYNNTDTWGFALNYGSTTKVETAGECCDLCAKARGLGNPDVADCNMWVWCGDKEKCGPAFQECWLKWLPYVTVGVPKATSMNNSVPWTSGTMADVDLTDDNYAWKLREERLLKGEAGKPKDPSKIVDTTLAKLKAGVTQPQMFHTITSVQGTYNQWQTRIHYYHWLKMKARCLKEGFCEMGGFTRLLHSGHPDNIMDEIPTIVVDPLPDTLLKHDNYVVLNRPYAFVTWAQTAKIPERYVLMAEPDHIMLRPLPNFMRGDRPAVFNFGYMSPAAEENCKVVMRHTGIKHLPDCETVAPTGNSPTYMTLTDMQKVMPIWLNLSMAVYKDQEAQKVWGWVQEMYAFSMSIWLAGIKQVDMISHMLAQPPYDPDWELMPGRPFYILHYTYGLDFNQTTGEVLLSKVGDWHFDKRDHDPEPLPRDMKEPADTVDFDLGRQLIRSFNEATAAIPCWQQYHDSKGDVVTKDCGEKPGGFYAELAASPELQKALGVSPHLVA